VVVVLDVVDVVDVVVGGDVVVVVVGPIVVVGPAVVVVVPIIVVVVDAGVVVVVVVGCDRWNAHGFTFTTWPLPGMPNIPASDHAVEYSRPWWNSRPIGIGTDAYDLVP